MDSDDKITRKEFAKLSYTDRWIYAMRHMKHKDNESAFKDED
jgi:hypothetical protein